MENNEDQDKVSLPKGKIAANKPFESRTSYYAGSQRRLFHALNLDIPIMGGTTKHEISK